MKIKCDKCKGEGGELYPMDHLFGDWETCPKCNGTGLMEEDEEDKIHPVFGFIILGLTILFLIYIFW